MQKHTIIPIPVQMTPGIGAFVLDPQTTIGYDAHTPALVAAAEYLAARLRPATGFPLPVGARASAQENQIHFAVTPADATLGDEGYELTITATSVHIGAPQVAGHFYAVQTLRQLLPSAVEFATVQPGPWALPAGTIRDYPRFPWRGAMLDIARHFFGVAEVKRYIDLLAFYKVNRLHLHLTDDQGWRIAIASWPRLAEVGGSTAVDGAAGGYYTAADFTVIVEYAAAHGMVVMPEIEMPGHVNAALAAYPELNRDGIAPAPFTGADVGFSSLCADKEITYRFVDDVLREMAALTPGPYLHIGGDEAWATKGEDYCLFVERVLALVGRHGKRAIGWEEIGQTRLPPGTVLQQWNLTPAAIQLTLNAAAQGAQIILSPASHTYLDMKYDESTSLGLEWAGHVSVQQSYAWEPATLIPGLDPAAILGVEAPIWSETLATLADVETMAFPRLPGIAEIGWSPAAGRGWEEYRLRLREHRARWEALGVNFYRATEIG